MIFGPTFAEMRDPGLVDPAAAGEGARGPLPPPRPAEPLEPLVEGRRRGALHRPARGPDRRPRADRGPLGPALSDRLPQGRPRLLDPGREAARRGVRAGRAHARLPLDRQLRDRRRLGRPAHGLPLARGAARGDERRALREDPRLRGRRDRDPGQRVERQGDLRQGPRAARRSREPDPEPVRGVRGTTASTSTAPRRRPQEVVGALGLEAGAFVSAMGSAGTIAAGEGLRRRHPGLRIVAVEPMQCPTLYNVGLRRPPHRGHRRQARDLDPQRVGHGPARLRGRPRVPGGPAAPAGGAGDARGGGGGRRSARAAGWTSSASAASATCSPRSGRPTTTASARGRRW